MLSKVLSGRHTEKASAAVFPIATVAPARPVHDTPDPNPGAAAAALREQQRRLEAQHEAERRGIFEDAFRQGQQAAQAELQPVLLRLNASISELTSLRADLRRRAERDAVQLSLLIARRVLHRELVIDENALNAIARVAFERLTRSESYRVRVHPRFAPALASALPADQAARVRIEPDPVCAPGTIVFQSAEGSIDASIDTQLEEISRGLADHLGFTNQELR